MAGQDSIRQYEQRQVRTHWDEENEQWLFSIVDVVAILTDQPDARHAAKYRRKAKPKLKFLQKYFRSSSRCLLWDSGS